MFVDVFLDQEDAEAALHRLEQVRRGHFLSEWAVQPRSKSWFQRLAESLGRAMEGVHWPWDGYIPGAHGAYGRGPYPTLDLALAAQALEPICPLRQLASGKGKEPPTEPCATGCVTDPKNPLLGRGQDEEPVPQNKAYLVLSEAERKKGYVKPVRRSYIHSGERPRYPLRDLTPEEKEATEGTGYVMFEAYPASHAPVTGRFWTQQELSAEICNGVTTMSQDIAETYARDPYFYGATYCVRCSRHRPLREFQWIEQDGSTSESMDPARQDR